MNKNSNQKPQPGQNSYPNRPVNGQRRNGVPSRNVQPSRQSVPRPPVKHRSRAQARAAMATSVVVAIIIMLLVVSLVILAARCVMGIIGKDEGKDEGKDSNKISSGDTLTSGAVIVTDTNGNPVVQSPTGGHSGITSPFYEVQEPTRPTTSLRTLTDDYHEIDVPSSDVTKGYQILVNYKYAFDFENAYSTEIGYNRRNRNYYVFDTTTTIESRTIRAFHDMTDDYYEESGNKDVLISSAFRNLEDQQTIYDYYYEMYGEEYALKFVAEPGYSEHHTGLAMDLSIFGDGRSFSNETDYADWFNKNAHKYGYVLRYPQDKVEITKIEYEYWHYRFVGEPHAYYMWKNNLCLEEYIELLSKHDYYEPLIITDDKGAEWEVYYTRASIDETTKVIVPKVGDYEISGNNVDGFIVTVKTKEAA